MIDRRYLLVRGIAAVSAVLLVPRQSFAAATAEPLRMRALYNDDMSFSDLALSLEGERIGVAGFMAPPLRAETRFWVLTDTPQAVCPFCDDAAFWPDDILAIYSKRFLKVAAYDLPIVSTGTLRLGEDKSAETGFVSRARLEDASYAAA